MQFHSFVSDHESTDHAAAYVARAAQEVGARPGNVDVAFVFFTGHHVEEASSIVARIRRDLDPQVIVGCSAEGVIGDQVEIERSPGVALLVGRLPGVRAHAFHIGADDWRPLLADPDPLRQRAGLGPETRAIIGSGDPFTTPLIQFMQVLDEIAPSAPLVGGMASSAHQPGENALLLNDGVLDDGFVGVSLSGPIDVQTLVSQGCRPIGVPMVVTRGRENVIEQLGGKSAVEVLRRVVGELSNEDQALLRKGLFVGAAMSEYREEFGRGDFVIRNLMRIDEKAGVIALTDRVRVGQTVQFHLRDAATADEDLSEMLAAQNEHQVSPAAAALLFSCNGRGTRMFEEPGHDVTCTRTALPGAAVAGFFAAGEIGPVGGKNFIHGYTASLAILRPREQSK
jgi:small ligand-binding sensory domain FIST